MAGNIFINYRRGDEPGFTQFLYARLEEQFSAETLVLDVEGHIEPGDDFVAIEIEAALVRGKRVTPVMVGGAGFPRAEGLPEPIRVLARRNSGALRPQSSRG